MARKVCKGLFPRACESVIGRDRARSLRAPGSGRRTLAGSAGAVVVFGLRVTASLPPEIQRSSTASSRRSTRRWRGRAADHLAGDPFYRPGGPCIDVSTGPRLPEEGERRTREPEGRAAFSDPTGSGLDDPPQVLVQGTAVVDDRDLDANRERYEREWMRSPVRRDQLPPKLLRGMFGWYFTRIYVHVRPERVYVWPKRRRQPRAELFDARMEEVRSRHDEEPAATSPGARGQRGVGPALDELGERYPHAVLSLVAPDGFPFSVRLPISVDRGAGRIRLGGAPVGVPLAAGAGLSDGARPLARLRLAEELPGAWRPGRGGRHGRWSAPASSAASSCRRSDVPALPAEREQDHALPEDRQGRAAQAHADFPRSGARLRFPLDRVRGGCSTSSRDANVGA